MRPPPEWTGILASYRGRNAKLGGDERAEHVNDIKIRFGPDVARIVADCTDSWVESKPVWRPRKQAYLVALPTKPSESLLVSLADKPDNAEAIL
jgi:(p)ppGpp synthase/HD superfamily hydrolase